MWTFINAPYTSTLWITKSALWLKTIPTCKLQSQILSRIFFLVQKWLAEWDFSSTIRLIYQVGGAHNRHKYHGFYQLVTEKSSTTHITKPILELCVGIESLCLCVFDEHITACSCFRIKIQQMKLCYNVKWASSLDTVVMQWVTEIQAELPKRLEWKYNNVLNLHVNFAWLTHHSFTTSHGCRCSLICNRYVTNITAAR